MGVQGGVLELKVNGTPVEVEASLTFSVGGLMREGQAYATGGGGPRVSHKVPFVEFAAANLAEGLAPEDFAELDDETVIMKLRDGRVYGYYHAWCTGAPDEDGIAGTGTIRFETKPDGCKRIE